MTRWKRIAEVIVASVLGIVALAITIPDIPSNGQRLTALDLWQIAGTVGLLIWLVFAVAWGQRRSAWLRLIGWVWLVAWLLLEMRQTVWDGVVVVCVLATVIGRRVLPMNRWPWQRVLVACGIGIAVATGFTILEWNQIFGSTF